MVGVVYHTTWLISLCVGLLTAIISGVVLRIELQKEKKKLIAPVSALVIGIAVIITGLVQWVDPQLMDHILHDNGNYFGKLFLLVIGILMVILPFAGLRPIPFCGASPHTLRNDLEVTIGGHMKEITIGAKAAAQMPVTEEKTAKQVGSGSLLVFATPMMAALMEQAACEALAPFLESGETTVGTELNIQHTAATPVGLNVTAEAEVTAVNGREIAFKVTARDDAGEIGSGTHKRFLVFTEKFQNKANGRGQ